MRPTAPSRTRLQTSETVGRRSSCRFQTSLTKEASTTKTKVPSALEYNRASLTSSIGSRGPRHEAWREVSSGVFDLSEVGGGKCDSGQSIAVPYFSRVFRGQGHDGRSKLRGSKRQRIDKEKVIMID